MYGILLPDILKISAIIGWKKYTRMADSKLKEVNINTVLKINGDFELSSKLLLLSNIPNRDCSMPPIQKKLTEPAIRRNVSYTPISPIPSFVFVRMMLIKNKMPKRNN